MKEKSIDRVRDSVWHSVSLRNWYERTRHSRGGNMAKTNSKKRFTEAEAAVLALQNAPVEVARDEAKHATDAPPTKPRGRKRKLAADPPPKRRGRPKGSKNKPKPAAKKVAARRGPGRPKRAASGLGQINGIVERMVEDRTRAVLRGAIAALKKATAAVENAL
jgi:hypothetical protein